MSTGNKLVTRQQIHVTITEVHVIRQVMISGNKFTVLGNKLLIIDNVANS